MCVCVWMKLLMLTYSSCSSYLSHSAVPYKATTLWLRTPLLATALVYSFSLFPFYSFSKRFYPKRCLNSSYSGHSRRSTVRMPCSSTVFMCFFPESWKAVFTSNIAKDAFYLEIHWASHSHSDSLCQAGILRLLQLSNWIMPAVCSATEDTYSVRAVKARRLTEMVWLYKIYPKQSIHTSPQSIKHSIGKAWERTSLKWSVVDPMPSWLGALDSASSYSTELIGRAS